jgi:hypothetical protein
MKQIVLTTLFALSAAFAVAQAETFDLVTYTPPKDWSKQVSESSITYTAVNEKSNTWCRIIMLKSTLSKGSIEADFESEWQDLIVKNYNPTEERQLNEVTEYNGWKIKAALVKFTFDKGDALAMLTTASGFQRCVSIVALTNSQDYLEDVGALISSVVLKDMTNEAGTPGVLAAQTDNNNIASILGAWGTSLVVPYRRGTEGTAGYTLKQYTLNANGTYTFYVKSFRYKVDKLLLVKENGTYQISGNTITINPQNSVIESWSKKDDTDEWGNLLSTETRALEKVNYQFTKKYFSGVDQWNLVLQANAETKRDGLFTTNSSFTNAYLYGPISDIAVIKLPN